MFRYIVVCTETPSAVIFFKPTLLFQFIGEGNWQAVFSIQPILRSTCTFTCTSIWAAVDVHRSTARWTVQSDDKTIRVSCETNQFTTEPAQKPQATMQDLTELIKKHVIFG